MMETFAIALNRVTGAARLRWAQRILIFLAVLAIVRKTLWMPALITGRSMLPTLHSGQIVGVNRLAFYRHQPRRGDIVFFVAGDELLVKRIIGLPGEQISVDQGIVHVNGRALREPYVGGKDKMLNVAAGKIPQNQFVVAGDNRSESVIAMLNCERIVGRLAGW
jgi:signal peptidase I